MNVLDHSYSKTHQVLGFRLDSDRFLFWGFGPMPGTSIYGFRFIMSSGFKDRTEYLQGQRVAHAYAQDQEGCGGVHDLFEACKREEENHGTEAS